MPMHRARPSSWCTLSSWPIGRRGTWLPVVVLLMLVAGCSPAAEPEPTLAVSASPVASAGPSPSPSPTATWPVVVALPTPPAEMARDDEVGAVAAARYFVTDLYRYTMASQDATAFDAVSHPECQFCASVHTSIASDTDAHHITVPGTAVIVSYTALPMSLIAYEVDLSINQDADVLWSSGGEFLGRNSPRQIQLAVFVVWRTDKWILRGVDLQPSSGAPK